MVVVFIGLFFLSLSIIALEILYFLISVYVDSGELLNVAQNGLYEIILSISFLIKG